MAEEQQAKRPFIPAWLDKSGLNQAEFRIYCHLSRSADNETGIAWPSYDSISKACFMARNTAWRTLRSLESKKFIRLIGKKFGGSNRYQVLFPIISNETPLEAVPSNEAATVSNQAPLEDWQSSQMEYSNSIKSDTPTVSDLRQEGSPKKVLQRRKPTREVSPEGVQFAQWFKSSLPETVNLKSNWQQSFAKVHDDMIRLDNRSSEEIRKVSRWARTDPFWKSNFMSPEKLRKRNPSGIQYFDVFAERMKQPNGHQSKPAATVDTGARPSNIKELHEI